MWSDILFIKPISIISIIAHFFINRKLKTHIDIYHGYSGIIFMIILIFLCSYIKEWRNLKEIKMDNTPCPREIIVNNDNGKIKEEFIFTMCTGDYDTQFEGKWDGKYIVLDSGKISYPKDLEQYISKPIKKAKIKVSEDIYIYDNKNSSSSPLFITDTLKIGKKYLLYGDISGIENQIPIISIYNIK